MCERVRARSACAALIDKPSFGKVERMLNENVVWNLCRPHDESRNRARVSSRESRIESLYKLLVVVICYFHTPLRVRHLGFCCMFGCAVIIGVFGVLRLRWRKCV